MYVQETITSTSNDDCNYCFRDVSYTNALSVTEGKVFAHP